MSTPLILVIDGPREKHGDRHLATCRAEELKDLIGEYDVSRGTSSFVDGTHGTRPLHAEVRAELTKRIDNAVYAADAPLPSASALAKEFGVSLITVKRALKDLQNEGLLSSRVGLGTFVKRPKRFVRDYNVSLNSMNDAERLGFEPRIELISIAMDVPAEILTGVPDLPTEPMRCVKKAIYADDIPIMYDVSFVSADLGDSFLQLVGKHLISEALTKIGVKIKKTELIIDATPASPETQAVCGVSSGYPCLLRRYRYETNRAGLMFFGQVESPFDKLSCTMSMES